MHTAQSKTGRGMHHVARGGRGAYARWFATGSAGSRHVTYVSFIRAEQRLRFDLYAGETSVCVFTPLLLRVRQFVT